jgi:hypothetical protein
VFFMQARRRWDHLAVNQVAWARPRVVEIMRTMGSRATHNVTTSIAIIVRSPHDTRSFCHQAQSTVLQACEKYCVERADPSWKMALDLVWGTSLPSLSLPQAHSYILPPDPVRDGESLAMTSTVPPPLPSLGISDVASMRAGISAPLSFLLVDASTQSDANLAPSMSSSARHWLRHESEADYSRVASDSGRSLPPLKESGLLDYGEAGPLPVSSAVGYMAGQQQQQHKQ